MHNESEGEWNFVMLHFFLKMSILKRSLIANHVICIKFLLIKMKIYDHFFRNLIIEKMWMELYLLPISIFFCVLFGRQTKSLKNVKHEWSIRESE